MAESFLIMLREGFEAALIVAIVFAYLRKIGRLDLARPVWLGTLAAGAVALIAGLGLNLLVESLQAETRVRAFAAISFAAAGLLTWMIFWMRKQARGMKRHLEGKVAEAVGQSATALAAVAFVAVLREGIETALFMTAVAGAADGLLLALGGVAGLVVACSIGVAVYRGSRRVSLPTFFRVTGLLVIIVAAGLLARGIFLLQADGVIGSANFAVYNLTGIRWLTIDTLPGQFLSGVLGWDPRPSLEQAAAWLLYTIPVGFMYFKLTAMRPSQRSA